MTGFVLLAAAAAAARLAAAAAAAAAWCCWWMALKALNPGWTDGTIPPMLNGLWAAPVKKLQLTFIWDVLKKSGFFALAPPRKVHKDIEVN